MVAPAHLGDYREVWRRKPALRAVYHDIYRRLAAACRPGRTLEVGGGSGNFKDFAPDVVATDVQAAPWLDLVCDAHALPFAAGAFDNIVAFDVLHHLHWPRHFISESQRILRPGGRLLMVEPAITPVSWVFYNYFHDEPVDLGADPLIEGPPERERDPYDANQAIATLLFDRRRAAFEAAFPDIRVKTRQWFSLFAYPLTGGFRRWSLIPAALVGPLLRLEAVLAPALGRLMGFRLLLVLERR